MRIRILETAEQDIEEGYRFYEEQSYGLGEYFLESIYSDIESLSIYGGIHPKIYEHYRCLSNRFPFAIYYMMSKQEVIVSSVLDCRRNPSWIRNKVSKKSD